MENNLLEKVVSLCKRRGFIFPGSEIYGGIGGFYDFGPLGTELKFNIKQAWWKKVVREREDVVGLNAAIIMNPKAWEASGHVSGFSDPLVECKKCHQRFKADNLTLHGNSNEPDEKLRDMYWECENCETKNKFTPEDRRQFNLMFKTFVGPVEDSASVAYLRPETAGGIFMNFRNVADSTRIDMPFGIAQIGKAFRNEINPKDYIFRTREFEQMEIEFFVKPGDDEKYFDEWVSQRREWYKALGLKHIREREQEKEERAHYSKRTIDIEYEFPFGIREIEGIANRGDFDLSAHSKSSGRDLSYTDKETGEKYIPYVIEPSAGADRIVLAFLCDAYTEEGDRTLLKLHPALAPYKAAVFPLLKNKPELVEKARSIYKTLKKDFIVAWDDRGNIGKRYYSQDEIGTPFCFTVDFQTLEDDTVTVRDRDSAKQERISVSELNSFLKPKIEF